MTTDSTESIKAMRFLLQYNRAGWCGPTSLSSCLSIFGVGRSPSKLIADINKSHLSATLDGVDENELQKMAESNAARALQIWTNDKKANGEVSEADGKRPERRYFDCGGFGKTLRAHVKKGYPALLCVSEKGNPFHHWVAVLAVDDQNRFVVMDPDEDDEGFDRWDQDAFEKASHAKHDDNHDQHLAILLTPEQQTLKPLAITPELIKLANACGVTSGERLEILSADLSHLLEDSGCIDNADGTPVHQWLEEKSPIILAAIDYWVDPTAREVSKDKVAKRLKSYIRCASALPITVPPAFASEARLLTGMTALLTAHAILKVDKQLSYGE